MKIYKDCCITINKKGEVWSNISPDKKWTNYTNQEDISQLLLHTYNMSRKKSTNNTMKLSMIQAITDKLAECNQDMNIYNDEIHSELTNEMSKQNITAGCQKMIDFFKEFAFSPNFRFMNTFTRMLNKNVNEGKQYIANYFKLVDNSYTNAIIDKMSSSEFHDICNILTSAHPSTKINNRFKLYYGCQGTGKTTEAMKETNNNVMICHSAMLPSDLMEDFNFNNGKAEFTPSALCKAMTEGKKIVLDEFNLLPFESLRFLQSILDNKQSFEYKGHTINIKDGFEIIGTMNLQVNGMIYALPEPLVDRAEELKEFTLTADNLVSAII